MFPLPNVCTRGAENKFIEIRRQLAAKDRTYQICQLNHVVHLQEGNGMIRKQYRNKYYRNAHYDIYKNTIFFIWQIDFSLQNMIL